MIFVKSEFDMMLTLLLGEGGVRTLGLNLEILPRIMS